jgi:radical SAM/Cys-rich protein
MSKSMEKKVMDNFDEQVSMGDDFGLYAADKLSTLQVNIGLICNLMCRHCHVNSSPKRKEEMQWDTMESILALADTLHVETIDITGGAPEMNPQFKRFVSAIRAKGINVLVRTNLTIHLEPGYKNFIEFFALEQVQLVASLPCYLEENVDKQRGEGVYYESIDVIKKLNAVGYGVMPELPLNLVYNPDGPSLPPNQASLEDDYHRELEERFGIVFTHLNTITNVPIGRFKTDLRRDKQLDGYMDTLRGSYNQDTVESLMCRHQVSIAWDGTLYDCDFNLALRMSTGYEASSHIDNLDLQSLLNRRIVTGPHCYACTAGSGSSCGGALV